MSEPTSALAMIIARIRSHDTHERRQIGPDVRCVDCDLNLYRGSVDAPPAHIVSPEDFAETPHERD